MIPQARILPRAGGTAVGEVGVTRALHDRVGEGEERARAPWPQPAERRRWQMPWILALDRSTVVHCCEAAIASRCGELQRTLIEPGVSQLSWEQDRGAQGQLRGAKAKMQDEASWARRGMERCTAGAGRSRVNAPKITLRG